MFIYKIRPWLRAIEGPTGQGSAAASADPTPDADIDVEDQADEGNEKVPEESDEEEPDSDESEDENPEGRGSKRAVLEDLSKERKKRQSVEAERDSEKTRADELEQEVQKLREQIADQEKQKADDEAKRQRDADVAAALKEVGLPAAMADRLRGDTLDDLTADAKSLAETLGYDRAPADPSQGKQGAAKPRGLAAAVHNKLLEQSQR